MKTIKELIIPLQDNLVDYYFKGKHTDLYVNSGVLKDFRVTHELDVEYVIRRLELK